MKFVFGLAAAAALGCAGMAFAQDTPAAATEVTPSAAPVESAAPTAGQFIQAGYVVDIALVEAVSSRTHKRGDTFPIQLVYPVFTDAGVLIPAGTRGVGEVVSAAPPGMMGKGGELLLAARYLDYNGQKIPLRSFKLGASGKDYTGALVAAAILAPLPGVILSFAVKGSDQTFPAGTLANAKLATDLTLPVIAPLAATSTTPQPQPAAAPSSSSK